MSFLHSCEDLNGTDGSRLGPVRTACYPDASISSPTNECGCHIRDPADRPLFRVIAAVRRSRYRGRKDGSGSIAILRSSTIDIRSFMAIRCMLLLCGSAPIVDVENQNADPQHPGRKMSVTQRLTLVTTRSTAAGVLSTAGGTARGEGAGSRELLTRHDPGGGRGWMPRGESRHGPLIGESHAAPGPIDRPGFRTRLSRPPRSLSFHRAQRKPMWVIAVSSAWAERAAGR
jgi:hypothetical protein